jgi:hypothetical protein
MQTTTDQALAVGFGLFAGFLACIAAMAAIYVTTGPDGPIMAAAQLALLGGLFAAFWGCK